MKLYVMDTGHIVMKRDNRVTTAGAGSDADAPHIPVPCYLLQTQLGYVLFDTGCDPEGMTKNWPPRLRANPYVCTPERTLLCQLERLHVQPDEVRYVVLSHLHLDHAGGLKAFTKARIIVSGAEFCKTLRAYVEHDFSGFHVQSDIENWLRAQLHWQLLDDGEQLQLGDEVTVLNFGSGHSYGMLGLLVKTKSHGTFLLPSDACYTSAHYENPSMPAGIVYDTEGYCRTVRKLHELAQHYNATVLFGHDPEQFASLVKLPEGYYE